MKLVPKYQEGRDVIRDYRPKLVQPVERTVNGKKWGTLTPKERFMNRSGFSNGRPTEEGLEIVSPEFEILTGVRQLLNAPKAIHALSREFNKSIANSSNKTINSSNKTINNRLPISQMRTPKIEANFSKARGNHILMNQMDDFATKYGYNKVNRKTILSDKRTNKQTRQLIARHNTYLRGVEPGGFEPDDIANVKKILGDDITQEDFLKYAATHKRSPDQGIWISPGNNAFVYGGKGKTTYVRRPYKLGTNRNKWFEEGDFDIQQRDTEITAPWFSSQYGRGLPESELLSNTNLNFAGWAKPNSNRVSLNNKVK